MLGRSIRAVLWLGPAALLWAVLAFVARVANVEGAAITNILFVLALPLTYVAGVGAVVHASDQPRRAVMRVAALTLGIIAVLTLLEMAAAVRLVHWELVFKALRGEQQHYVSDADLGFRHTPNARGSGRLRSDVEVACGLPASRADRVTVTYDPRGYRNVATLTRADIVLIGDSYVEGAYVSDDEVVSGFLQARLRRPVANLGVAGYGTAQELIVLERDALPFEPRVVIWFFFEGNDLYNDQEFENALLAPRERRAEAWTARHGWWRRSLVRNAAPHPALPAGAELLSLFRRRQGRVPSRPEGALCAGGGLPLDGFRAESMGTGAADAPRRREGDARARGQPAAGLRADQVPGVPRLHRAVARRRAA